MTETEHLNEFYRQILEPDMDDSMIYTVRKKEVDANLLDQFNKGLDDVKFGKIKEVSRHVTPKQFSE